MSLAAESPTITVESPLNEDSEAIPLASNPAKHLTVHRFTSENAKAMVAKAWEIRREREAQRRKSEESMASSDDGYRKASLARTREEVSECEKAMQSLRKAPPEDFERKYKALTDALYRLREIERLLAGRPTPGNRRPGREQPAKRQAPGSGPMPLDAAE